MVWFVSYAYIDSCSYSCNRLASCFLISSLATSLTSTQPPNVCHLSAVVCPAEFCALCVHVSCFHVHRSLRRTYVQSCMHSSRVSIQVVHPVACLLFLRTLRTQAKFVPCSRDSQSLLEELAGKQTHGKEMGDGEATP